MDKKNKKIPSDLVGFKEFIEYDDIQTGTKKPKEISQNFDLLSFLENESIRLSKTINLCEEQTYTINKFNQSEFILEKQEQIINKNKLIITELLRRKDSPLTANLKEILSLHFSY